MGECVSPQDIMLVHRLRLSRGTDICRDVLERRRHRNTHAIVERVVSPFPSWPSEPEPYWLGCVPPVHKPGKLDGTLAYAV